MRMQSTEATCGAMAVVNALAILGVSRTEDEVAVMAGTNSSGTSTRGMLRALRLMGREPTRIEEKKEGYAILRLLAALNCGFPTIIAVDRGSHWVAAIGTLGAGSGIKVLLGDSGSLDLVVALTPTELAHRWRDARSAKPYEGIIL
jgi:ABC-type bacteriocin/lantibiotic exporter with double-glycine peptidase domain